VTQTHPSSSGPVQFPCGQCGSRLVYAPGTSSLRCPSCGSERAIPETPATIEELDLETALAGRLGISALMQKFRQEDKKWGK